MNKERKLKCEKCSKTFKHRQSKFKHAKYCGVEDSILYSSLNSLFVCGDCGKEFKQNKTLKRHQEHCSDENIDSFQSSSISIAEDSSFVGSLNRSDTYEFRCSMAFDPQVVPDFEATNNSTFSQEFSEISSTEKHCDFEISFQLPSINISSVPVPDLEKAPIPIDLETPNSTSTYRVSVHRLSKHLCATIETSYLEEDLNVIALANTIKSLNLPDKLKSKLTVFKSNRMRSGRKLTSLETCLQI